MKRYIMLVSLVTVLACQPNSTAEESHEELVVNHEEKLIDLYKDSIIPLFSEYKETEIPTIFKVDETDLGINAGAAFGYVEVSKGLTQLKNEALQIFVLSHELGHIVTLAQAQKYNLSSEIPKGNITNDYVKAEYLADLIAVYLMKQKLPEEFKLLKNDFHLLEALLGAETFTHPSGKNRLNAIKDYINQDDSTETSTAFYNSFIKIWKMD